MISYLTPEQASALHAGGNAPMQIVDPTTRRVYYVIDSDFFGRSDFLHHIAFDLSSFRKSRERFAVHVDDGRDVVLV